MVFLNFLTLLLLNSCSFLIISSSIFSEFNAIGFDAAICIDNCLPNNSNLSFVSVVSNETITPNLDTLSFITEC